MASMRTLRQYLAENGLTQAAFAERIGVLQATVSKLCGDDPAISAEMAVKIERETGGIVPVESWPKFRPLLHRASAAPTMGAE